uniref:RING-type domain-containing protein n=1 Tax=Steinernema glaseri TaxID=37863 RepID=A0A1I8AAE4_9BILA
MRCKTLHASLKYHQGAYKHGSPWIASSRGLTMSSTLQPNCSICLDWLVTDTERAVVITNCHHIFHKECVQNWVRTQRRNKGSCPTCRRSMGTRKKIFFSTARFSQSSSEQELVSGSRGHWKCGECHAKMSASHDVMKCLDCRPALPLTYLCPKCAVSNHQCHKIGIVPLASSEALQEGLKEMKGRISDRDAALERLHAVAESVSLITASLKYDNHVATEAVAELSDASVVSVLELQRHLEAARGDHSVTEESRRLADECYDHIDALMVFLSPQSVETPASPERSPPPRAARSPSTDSSSSSSSASSQSPARPFRYYRSDAMDISSSDDSDDET